MCSTVSSIGSIANVGGFGGWVEGGRRGRFTGCGRGMVSGSGTISFCFENRF
jgi:hypothetical protein